MATQTEAKLALKKALTDCYAAGLDNKEIMKYVTWAKAEAQREADAKTMDRATYREKHGCVAEPPKADGAKAGK